MKVLWEYVLPSVETPRSYLYEGPLLVSGGRVFYAGYGAKRRPGADVVRLHRIDVATGVGDHFEFEVEKAPLTSHWSLTSAGGKLLFHASAFFDCTDEPTRIGELTEGELIADKHPMRPKPLVRDKRVFFANSRTAELNCFDLEARRLLWTQPLDPVEPYRIGAPLWYGDRIACFGQGALLVLDAESGAEVSRLKIPRIDKLYSPIADGDDMLLGYTNWSVAGALRLGPDHKVQWQHRRKFEGPNSYCHIWKIGDVVVWVKGETEIIGVDARTGEERWRVPASPYLYTRLRVIGEDLLFGTAAGCETGLRRISALTGELKWERNLNNGCSYYALHDDRIYAGDFDKRVYCLDVNDGKELDRIDVDTHVIGDIAADGDRVYTIIWPNEDNSARLICLSG